MGDEGLSQCAGKCDAAANCVAYSMTETGLCTMLQAINVSVTACSKCCSDSMKTSYRFLQKHAVSMS
jgi:hypothetical protein